MREISLLEEIDSKMNHHIAIFLIFQPWHHNNTHLPFHNILLNRLHNCSITSSTRRFKFETASSLHFKPYNEVQMKN